MEDFPNGVFGGTFAQPSEPEESTITNDSAETNDTYLDLSEI